MSKNKRGLETSNSPPLKQQATTSAINVRTLLLDTLRSDPALKEEIKQIVNQQKSDGEIEEDMADALEPSVAEQLKERVLKLEERVAQLERDIEDQKRYSRTWCLRFLGVEEQENENLYQVLHSFFNNTDCGLGLSISNSIEYCHRLPSKPKPTLKNPVGSVMSKSRVVIARFYSRTTVKRILASLRMLKGKNCPIVVLEDLTPRNLAIYNRERNILQGVDKRRVFTRDGYVFLHRGKENSPLRIVN
ncbi:unnamed protein product [Didymodactylos carnosus]|uniref:Uncharacterized protein n=1 Tax=Didymodactylos carnosus TaxID=1234261 RepID=A0A8S2DJE3_9BILA|nr:unnamed protein product [Didymodactylos carnosus]CAF3717873.1 unnamed protein product [Didymodactylos carnosus]